MLSTTNKEIRARAAASGVYLWQIAERFGVSASYFSCRLRHELNETDRKRVFEIIEQIKADRERGVENG